jgi:hypothetical protein
VSDPANWSTAAQTEDDRIGPGDTVWIGGGTYTNTIIPRGNGTAANPIQIKRAVSWEAACTAAAGWGAGFDAQVVIDKTSNPVAHYSHSIKDGRYSAIYFAWHDSDSPDNVVFGSHLIFDGMVTRGMLLKGPAMGFDQTNRCVATVYAGHANANYPCRDQVICANIRPATSKGGLENITFRNLEVRGGTGGGAKYSLKGIISSPVAQHPIRFTRDNDKDHTVDGLTFQNVECWGGTSTFRLEGCRNVLIEGCDLHTVGNLFPERTSAPAPYTAPDYDAPHASGWSMRGNQMVVCRNSRLHHFTAPTGLGIYSNADADYTITGNLIWNPPGFTGSTAIRAFGLITPVSTPNRIRFNNNTVVGIPRIATVGSTVTTSNHEARNNIIIGATTWDGMAWGNSGGVRIQHDYNHYDVNRSTAEDNEPNGTYTASTDLFVNWGSNGSYAGTDVDFRLRTPTAPGIPINDPICELDPDGVLRGVDGSWDKGAFEYTADRPSSETGTDLLDGLILHWAFDEISGRTILDRSGSQLHGQLANGGSWSVGKYNGALRLTGFSEFAVANNAAPLVPPDAITVTVWIKPERNGAYQQIVGKVMEMGSHRHPYGSWALNMADAANGFVLRARVTTEDGAALTIRTPDVIPYGTWVHAALSFDGSALRLFVNGTLVSSGSAAGRLKLFSGPCLVGVNGALTDGFKGLIDEIRVYRRSLSATDLTGLVRASAPAATEITQVIPLD